MRQCYLPVLATLMLAAVPAPVSGAESDKRWLLSADLSNGAVEGYLQTPQGGQPGTSSERRPTLEELNIDRLTNSNFSLAWSEGRHQLALSAHFLSERNDAVLGEALISQGLNFVDGERISTDLNSDWWEVNYSYELFTTAMSDIPLSVYVGAGAVLLRFHYDLQGSNAAVHRRYTKGGYRAGLAADLQLMPRLILSTKFFDAFTVSNTTKITNADLYLSYQIWDSSRMEWYVTGGVSYQDVHYQGNQELTNHIKLRMHTLSTLGIEIRF